MLKIIKSGRPLVVSRTYETHRRCSCQPLDHINRNRGSVLGGRLPQRALDDLGPGTSAPRFSSSSATARSPPSIAHESSIRAMRSELITIQPPYASRCQAAPRRRIANAIASSSRPGTSRPPRSVIVQAGAWMPKKQTCLTAQQDREQMSQQGPSAPVDPVSARCKYWWPSLA